ncbi:hypothetical protein PV458_25730 [Streptomyces sp. MN03-5084-2B]|nr:hypothetical protein [Streptomyces sp. MN03-5084-2B]
MLDLAGAARDQADAGRTGHGGLFLPWRPARQKRDIDFSTSPVEHIDSLPKKIN